MSKEIKLTQGQVAIVDDEDFERVNKYKWYAYYDKRGKTWYSRRHVKNTHNSTISMHRFIMNDPKGFQVDHKNHNTLDNRKENLRKCTHQENCFNRRKQSNCTTEFIGVSFCKDRQKYLAAVEYNGKTIRLGYYTNPIDAAAVRDKKVKEVFKEYAVPNFPDNV
jgi:hypothetical protein